MPVDPLADRLIPLPLDHRFHVLCADPNVLLALDPSHFICQSPRFLQWRFCPYRGVGFHLRGGFRELGRPFAERVDCSQRCQGVDLPAESTPDVGGVSIHSSRWGFFGLADSYMSKGRELHSPLSPWPISLHVR